MATNTSTKSKLFTLSPSRAKDYLQCALMYKFKVIDKLPSPPSFDAFRGTHIHAILEDMYKQPLASRTLTYCVENIWIKFDETLRENPSYVDSLKEIKQIQDNGAEKEVYRLDVIDRLENYFKLESPEKRPFVTAQEKWISTTLNDELRIGGFIDRLEENGSDALIADYKTGKKPDERFQNDALFQMYFYALIWSKEHKDIIPKQVKLLYLKDAGLIVESPTQDVLDRMESDILDIWNKIKNSTKNNDWPSKRSKLCDWCNFQELCPEFA